MLTDVQCRNANCPPERKQARFADAGGLYLQVTPTGSKRWFYKYRTEGKEKQLALGSYPSVSLTAARKARDIAMREMMDDAHRLGGNAIVGVDLDYETININGEGGMLMVTASGTAVVVD